LIQIKSNDTTSAAGIAFGQYVSPICLPASNLVYPANLNLTITGWGKLGYEGVNSDMSNLPKQNALGAVIQLQKASVPLLSPSSCTAPKVIFNDFVPSGLAFALLLFLFLFLVLVLLF
jgi:hypothetical protein